jgi:hypothetical protein
MGSFCIFLPSKASPNKVVTTPALILTRGIGGHAGDILEITSVLHHQRGHSQASMALGPKAFLSGGKILSATLNLLVLSSRSKGKIIG